MPGGCTIGERSVTALINFMARGTLRTLRLGECRFTSEAVFNRFIERLLFVNLYVLKLKPKFSWVNSYEQAFQRLIARYHAALFLNPVLMWSNTESFAESYTESFAEKQISNKSKAALKNSATAAHHWGRLGILAAAVRAHQEDKSVYKYSIRHVIPAITKLADYSDWKDMINNAPYPAATTLPTPAVDAQKAESSTVALLSNPVNCRRLELLPLVTLCFYYLNAADRVSPTYTALLTFLDGISREVRNLTPTTVRTLCTALQDAHVNVGDAAAQREFDQALHSVLNHLSAPAAKLAVPASSVSAANTPAKSDSAVTTSHTPSTRPQR
jgi:hypothetical protein